MNHFNEEFKEISYNKIIFSFRNLTKGCPSHRIKNIKIVRNLQGRRRSKIGKTFKD